MAADDASDAEALFCLELYVHRVERLPRRLREAPPALALRFLDYAPVIVEPPSGARGNHRGSCWYGCGKRCVFEAPEGELAKKLRQRRDAALLCHAVEAGRPVRRRLYGSSKVALPNFGENEENEAPLGAVRTWGRAECRVLLENAHGRVVGAATVSVSLASLDAGLRKCLGAGAPVQQLRLSVDVPVGDARRPKSSDVSPNEVRQSGAGELDLAWSDDDLEHDAPPSTETFSPPSSSKSPGAFSNSCAAEATLVFAGASISAFDDAAKAALIEALARRAGVSPDRVTITNYRAGSLVVDCRIDFPEEAHARDFADEIAAEAPEVAALGACEVLKARVPYEEDYGEAAEAPEVYVEAYGEAAAGPDVVAEAPAFAAAPPSEAPHLKHHARAPPPVSPQRTTMTYPYRSLDVFRGEAVLVDDDDDLYEGDCPKPFYYATHDLPPPEVFVAPDAVLSPIKPPPPSPVKPRGDPWLALATTASHDPAEGVVFEPVPDPAAPPPPPTPPKLDSKRSEAHKGAAPRFRMSILTDYAGVVSETVTDERLPAHVEGEENNEDNLEFRTLLNFEKVGRGERKRCVMCGREAEAEDRRRAGCEPQCCVIPKQCKDVCDACTKSTWRHRATDVYFKWCQGCKKFRSIPAFANKRHTAKCDACRKRGREGYHKKVKKNKEDESPAK
mmetsp:Transcript_20958/g.54618  ORF Transcript_20958/g.54618 Transcript_20958/m.54618 type:complete len:675 (-) Transcript_20958:54-2078(-)